jgi:Cu/Ag efflux protein CusF
MMNIASRFALSCALALSSVSLAIAGDTQSAAVEAAASASTSHGEIKKIIKDAGKLTIKHGELKNLDMPPMTMVFRVQDPSMLDQVKVGDEVDFVVEKVGGQFTVTEMKVVK